MDKRICPELVAKERQRNFLGIDKIFRMTTLLLSLFAEITNDLLKSCCWDNRINQSQRKLEKILCCSQRFDIMRFQQRDYEKSLAFPS